MGRPGFIHDKLDIKFLVLYLMARTAAPVDFAILTELALCDDGVDYFDYAESVAELVETGHLKLEEGLYSITDKGRKNSAICESSLAYSIRLKCDQNLTKVNAELRRNAQVRAEILPREDGSFTLKLSLDDDGGNLLTLELLTVSVPQAEELASRFRTRPEAVYNGILEVLLAKEKSKDSGRLTEEAVPPGSE